MSAPKLTNAERISRTMKGPAISYLDLEMLIVDAEVAVKLFLFVFGKTITDNACVDTEDDKGVTKISLGSDDFTALVEAENNLVERVRQLVDGFDHAHHIEDIRWLRPVEEQVP